MLQTGSRVFAGVYTSRHESATWIRILRYADTSYVSPSALSHCFQAELINEHLALFVVSTTGSGREPRAMTPLWQMLLRADLPEDLFEDLNFAVFALGDTSYEKFCWPGKLLSRRLAQLGANELCVRGEGDEQHHLG